MRKVNANREKKIRGVEITLFFLLFCLLLDRLPAQNTTNFPNYFYSSHLSLVQLNPGAQIQSDVFTGIQYQSSFGALSRINSFQGDLAFRFNKNQSLGFQVWNSNEGPFIQRNRFYGLYNIKISLNKNAKLSSGLKLGLINHRFKASTSSPASAGNAFDISFGLEFENKSIKLGGAFSQIPRSEIVVISEAVGLPRYFDFYGSYTFEITPQIKFIPFAKLNIVPELEEYLFQISANFSAFEDKLSGGIHGLLGNGIAPHAQFLLPFSDNYNLQTSVTYFQPLGSIAFSNFPLSRIEIGLIFTRSK